MMTDTAIVFACDEAYVFLARGLVLSLADAGYPRNDTKLILIDIGCEPESLTWMKNHGVEIVPFDPAFIPPTIMSIITPAQRAMAMRPWLPDMLPQFEHFVWLDCDLWLQGGAVMDQLRAGANARPDAIMLAPGVSHYNIVFYGELDPIMGMQRRWFECCCEPEFAKQASASMHLSGGVWGLRRSSPFWAHWRKEIERVYSTIAARDPGLIHLAEQIALNIVALRTMLIIRLDPLYNFHCNGGGAMRLPDGRVMTNMLMPPREISVIHLANWSLLRERYISEKLLYRGGDYLSPAERSRLTQ